MSKRTLFVGDVHGCYTELKGLLEMANFKPDSERLFFVGDLINRGPKPLEVLKLAHRLGASCVLGNHERSFLQHLKKGSQSSDSFSKLKEEMGDQMPFWEECLQSLPLFISEGGRNRTRLFPGHPCGLGSRNFPSKHRPPHSDPSQSLGPSRSKTRR